MDNRKKNKSRSKAGKTQSGSKAQKIEKRQHMVLEELPVLSVVEPHPVCTVCGNTIDLISQAICEPDGGYSHFDCVLERLKEQYQVQEPDKVSYIGHGNFAVVGKDENGSFIIKERIPYESKESYEGIKKFVEETKQ